MERCGLRHKHGHLSDCCGICWIAVVVDVCLPYAERCGVDGSEVEESAGEGGRSVL